MEFQSGFMSLCKVSDRIQLQNSKFPIAQVSISILHFQFLSQFVFSQISIFSSVCILQLYNFTKGGYGPNDFNITYEGRGLSVTPKVIYVRPLSTGFCINSFHFQFRPQFVFSKISISSSVCILQIDSISLPVATLSSAYSHLTNEEKSMIFTIHRGLRKLSLFYIKF